VYKYTYYQNTQHVILNNLIIISYIGIILHTHTHTHTQTNTHTHTHTQTHTRAYTHEHAHTHNLYRLNSHNI